MSGGHLCGAEAPTEPVGETGDQRKALVEGVFESIVNNSLSHSFLVPAAYGGGLSLSLRDISLAQRKSLPSKREPLR